MSSQKKNRPFNVLQFHLATLILLFFSVSGYSQRSTVSGLVTDSITEAPLNRVSVKISGSLTGTTTDANGTFRIQAKNGDILVFSSVGYEDKSIVFNNQELIHILLVQTSEELDEVVAVGYGTKKKVNLTGAVVAVTGKEIQKSPAINLTNALTGLLPGLITMNRSGQPGFDEAEILIRGRSTTGNNAPLILVDGGLIGPWSQINPNDIESISVLKDASAAIYGMRAANGVILITTKRGKAGKPVINYNFNYGITHPTRIPTMGDSYTYGKYVNDILTAQNQQPRFTEAELQKFKDGSDPVNYPSTNWLREILRTNSSQNQHSLSVSGGNEKSKYYIAGSAANQQGMFVGGATRFRTYSIRSNIDAEINKYLKVGLDLNGIYEDRRNPAQPYTNIFRYTQRNFPYMPVYWTNGLPSPGLERGFNPARMVSDSSGYDNSRRTNVNVKGSFDFSVPWISGLHVDGFAVISQANTFSKYFQRPWKVWSRNATTNEYVPTTGGSVALPDLRVNTSVVNYYLYNLRLRYEKRFDKHNISAFVASEQSGEKGDLLAAYRRDFLSSAVDQLFMGSATNATNTGSGTATGYNTFFSRISYGFNDRYLLDVNLRYDGSYIFPEGKQYGFFPGVSVAWRISQEKFFQNANDFIDELKIRASHGQIGNDRVAAFQHLMTYTINANLGYWFGAGAAPPNSLGMIANVNPNPDITWEVAKKTNLGFDVSLWERKLGVIFDIFSEKRSNILTTRSQAVPFYIGLTLPSQNIGVVNNRGIELQLTHQNKINNKLQYRTGVNFAYAKSKIIDISESENIPAWRKSEGRMLGSALYYRAIGIFRTQQDIDTSAIIPGTKVGDLKYADIDGDRKITATDRVRMERSNIPRMQYAFNLGLDYSQFSLTALFAGATKTWQYYFDEAGINANTLQDLLENRYTTGSMTSKYPWIPTTQSEVSGLVSDFWLRNSSYLRLKSLELSYTIPQNIISKLWFNGCRVYLTGFNLFTITKIKDYDPEGSDSFGEFYPQTKVINLGLNINF